MIITLPATPLQPRGSPIHVPNPVRPAALTYKHVHMHVYVYTYTYVYIYR